MLLAIDVGNTNITFGLFEVLAPRERSSSSPVVKTSWRLSTRRDATSDDYGALLLALLTNQGWETSRITAVAVASVVPPLDPVFEEISKRFFGLSPFFITPQTKTGIKILYHPASEVGADRIVNAVAAYARVRSACLVVDFGTATTFDCIDRRGNYLGGAIVPGPQAAAQVLFQKTAKLPLLGAFKRPEKAIGKNTVESMQSGLFYGYLGMTEELIRRLKAEIGGKPRVLATGGFSVLLEPFLKGVQEVVPDLTLEGLKIIWDKNK